jgi:hypothetical protein
MRKVRNLAKAPFPLPDVVTKVVPAPTEGWDAISPLAAMDPKRAPILTNWVPRPGWVELRAGYAPWAWLGGSSPVDTIMVWRGGTSQDKMFGAMGTGIYECTSAGQNTQVVSGLSSARWQYVNFRPAVAGVSTNYIQCVNGVDQLRMFDGTTWTTPSITGFPGSLNTTDITNIYAQKRRLWYILGNGAGGYSTMASFLGTDAVSGAIAGTIDLGATWTKGGYLVAMSDWTVDGGNGPQDYAVFISSRGQVTIYSGTDPTSSTAWSLVGTFDLSPPLGWRCMTRVGSDVAVITLQGVIPLSQALPFDPSSDRSVSITARIQNAMAQAAMQASTNFGWQLISFPGQQLAILNVPLTEGVTQNQYVMNALTGAWCEFTGWNANCFEIYNNNLYFGDNMGVVNQAYTGGLDGAASIPADMQCAYNYFDDPGRTKRVTMVQPLLTAGGNITPTLSVDEDFVVSSATAPVTILTGGAVWDSAIWDTATWPNLSVQVTNWLSVDAIGHALAVHMSVNVVTQNTNNLGEFDLSEFDTAQFDQGASNIAPNLQVNAFNAIMELGGFV